MPTRLFVSASLEDLTKKPGGILAVLESAFSAGSATQLKNSTTGFLVVYADRTLPELRNIYQAARYEAWLKVNTLDDADERKADLLLLYTNPMRETITRVRANYSGQIEA